MTQHESVLSEGEQAEVSRICERHDTLRRRRKMSPQDATAHILRAQKHTPYLHRYQPEFILYALSQPRPVIFKSLDGVESLKMYPARDPSLPQMSVQDLRDAERCRLDEEHARAARSADFVEERIHVLPGFPRV